jgi:uncharacterized membrane protein
MTPTAKDALSDPKKLAAAGVAMAALPVAVEQVAKRVAPKVSNLGEQAKQKAGEQAKQVAKDAAASKLKPESLAGGGLLSKLTPGSSDDDDGGSSEGGGVLSKLKPGSSDGGGDEKGRAAPGHGGSGRRMPVQQSVDVAVPIKVAYNRWTMFEDWPEFMHRLESVEQVDDAKLSFRAKVWGITRPFQAEIVEQRPDQRIEWNVTEGLAHTGVVTFHKLAERLTRIEVSLDIEPHGMLEKMGRGMRFTKRAIRADLHRFKALTELDEEAEGGWRGTIEDGEVKRRTERRSNRSGGRRRTQSANGPDPSSSSGRGRIRKRGSNTSRARKSSRK